MDKERLDRLKAERDRIDREMEKLNRDREKLDKTKSKLDSKILDRKPVDKVVERAKLSSKDSARPELKKSIDLKSQNTYRIDKNSNEKKLLPGKSDNKYLNGHNSQAKLVPKQLQQKDGALSTKKVDVSVKINGHVRPENGKRLPDIKGAPGKRPDDRRLPPQAGPSKSKISKNFDFDKHVSSLKSKQFPPEDVKRKQQMDDRKKARRKYDYIHAEVVLSFNRLYYINFRITCYLSYNREENYSPIETIIITTTRYYQKLNKCFNLVFSYKCY